VKATRRPEFFIRRFNAIYCAGFIEPRQVVIRPSTKTAQDFHMDFIKAVLVNICRGTEQSPGRRRIQVAQVQQEFFPGVNEPKLRTVLHQFAKFYREQGNGFWERKDVNLDETFQRIEITPEMVCRYQAMLVGQWKLRQNGVNILTKSKRVCQQIQNLRGELTRRVAEKIEIELMKTPWARTDNFSKAFQGHAVQIEHTEDGGQIMRSKSRRGKIEILEGKDTTTPAVRRQLAGTEADLRSLTLRELREKLILLGVNPSVIDEISRWKQVDLLKRLANRQKEDGTVSELAEKYARGPRNDYAASIDAYKRQYQATFENNLSFINTTNPVGADDQFDDGNILDDISLQMMREDREDEDDGLDLSMDDSTAPTRRTVAREDPPELVPYGICTCPTRIEWDKLGFANYPMRTVAKLISISWTREEGLHVEVQWRRSPHQIEGLLKNPSNVYPDQGQKGPGTPEDLEEYILKQQSRALQDKMRRTRQAARSRGPKTLVQAYLPVHHQLPFVNDIGGNHLTFRLTPEIIQKVRDASERFKLFEKINGRVHPKKKKTSTNDNKSDDDSDDTAEVTAPKRRIGRQNPLVLLNELLKKLLARLLQRPGDEFWPFKKPILRKEVPDYFNVVRTPLCFEDIERKANNLEYTTISKFYADVKQIEANCRLYNTGRSPELVALGEKMISEFQNELQAMRDELDQREAEIDPVLRSGEK
jgi:hypothetical protein